MIGEMHGNSNYLVSFSNLDYVPLYFPFISIHRFNRLYQLSNCYINFCINKFNIKGKILSFSTSIMSLLKS